MDLSTTPGADRRRSPRQRPATGLAKVVCQRGELFLGPNLAAGLVDASEGGVGIRAKEALRVGERVSVSLEGVGLPATVKRLGRVAWCEPAADGTFRAGVELDAPLEYTELAGICR